MGLIAGKNARIHIAGYDISGKSNQFSVSMSRAFKNVAGFGSDGPTWFPLLHDHSFSFNAFYDDISETTGVQACLRLLRGATEAVISIQLGNTIEDEAIGGYGAFQDVYGLDAPVGDMLALRSGFKPESGFILDYMLAFPKATKTSDGSHTAIDGSTVAVHKIDDVVNPASSADATDQATLNTLLNEIKADYNAHRVSTTYHSVADTTNVVDAADASTEATSVTLANQIKAKYNAHRSQSGVHLNDDAYNEVTSADATNLATAQPLANEIKADYNLHLITTNSKSGAEAILQVFACGADDGLIVKIQHDDVSNFATASDLMTFTTANGITAERKTASGVVQRYVRVNWAGTPTYSASFAVIFKRI